MASGGKIFAQSLYLAANEGSHQYKQYEEEEESIDV
jgi:hypothetical protein